MDAFTPSYFFDLSSYEHAALFETPKNIWEALAQIKPYLSKQNLGKIEIAIPEGVYLTDPHLISIGKGSTIESGAYIKGPCLIGSNCTIRQGAYIRGNVIVGNHCVIGHATELKHSILLDHASAAHFAYVGNSILGNRVNLGAGTKCANLKLNNGSVAILYQNAMIDTGLRKLGAIIGDDSQLGCNAVTNPGTLIGKHVLCYPVINITGFVPSNSIVKNLESLSIKTR